MGWKRTEVSEQRRQFVIRAASGKERMAALCREFGISRPTGYLWRQRFAQARTVTALAEKSRRPWHSPGQTGPGKEQRVMALRREHGWGAKKIAVLLREEGTELTVTTINRILKRRRDRPEEQPPPGAGGSVWWSTTNGYGLTWLSVRLIEQGIRLYYGRARHPQTQGKVERFHRTLDEAIRHGGKPEKMAE